MKWILILILLASFCFGQYTFTTIEEFEFDVSRGHYAVVVAMNDSIFVVLYTGGNSHGTVLKSYEVDSDYTNITLIDSIQVITGYSAGNEIVKIDNDKVLIVFSDGANIKVRSYFFDVNFDNITQISTHTLAVGAKSNSDLILAPVTNTQAVLIGGDNNVGFVRTIEWDGAGDNIATTDALVFDSGKRVENTRIIAVNDSIYIACFYGNNGDPYVNSFNVGVNFNNIRDINELALFTTTEWTDIAYISSTHALTWYGDFAHNDSYYETISFDVGTGANIASVQTLTETQQDPGTQLASGELLQYPGGGDYIMWREYNSLWNVRSYAIDGSYNVTDNGDSTKFSNITPQTTLWGGVKGDLLDSATNTYILVYSEETTWDGYVQTMTITDAGGWAHKINTVETPTAVNSASDFTKVSGVE